MNRKAEAGHVIEFQFKAEPAPAFPLGDCAGGVGAGEDVEDEIAGAGEEANEELGQLLGEAGGMLFRADGVAAGDILPVGLGIRDLQKIGRDGSAIVFAEGAPIVVAARAFLGRVEGGGGRR